MKRIAHIHFSYDETTLEEQLDFMSLDLRKRNENIILKRFVLTDNEKLLVPLGVDKISNIEIFKDWDEIIIFYKKFGRYEKLLSVLSENNKTVRLRPVAKADVEYLIKWENWFKHRIDAFYYSTKGQLTTYLNCYYVPLSFNFSFIKDPIAVPEKCAITLNLFGCSLKDVKKILKKFQNLERVFQVDLKLYIVFPRASELKDTISNLKWNCVAFSELSLLPLQDCLRDSFLFLDYSPCFTLENLSNSKILRLMSMRFQCIHYSSHKLDSNTPLIESLTDDDIRKFITIDNFRKEESDLQEKALGEF